MTTPLTFAALDVVDDLPTLEAALLASVSDAGVNSWATESPQFGLLEGEAQMMRISQIQRLILAYTASPRQLLRLRARLVELGYSAADAAAIVTSWVDVAIGWYGDDFARIPAQYAEWTIGVKVSNSAAPATIDGSTKGFFQSDDGTFFEFAQDAAVTLNIGSSYKGTIRIRARTAGTGGNVQAGTITAARGPAGLSVDNIVTQVLQLAGRDPETDEAVVARAEARWGTIGAAWSLDAFDYWIPTVAPTVTRWRVRDDNPRGPGTVVVKLATAAGSASPEEVALVLAKLGGRSVKALGSGQLYVEAATLHALSLSATLQGNGQSATLGADATAAIEALGAAFPLGPAELVLALATEVLMGAAVDTISVPNGPDSTTITPHLRGFAGVQDVLSMSLVAPETVGDGEVLVITATITGV